MPPRGELPVAPRTELPVLLVCGEQRSERAAMQRVFVAAGFCVRLASSRAEAAKCLAHDNVRAVVILSGGHGRWLEMTATGLAFAPSPAGAQHIPFVHASGDDPTGALEAVRNLPAR